MQFDSRIITAACRMWRGLRNSVQKPNRNRSSTWRLGARRRAIDNQELLIHEQAVGDDGFRAAGSREFGDCDQIDGRGVPADPSWQSRVEKVAFMSRLAKCPYSGDN